MADTTATLSPRQQRKREEMINNILAMARAIMREEGVAAFSLQELARRLDLRAPSIYHYFEGKTAIYDALFRLGFKLYAEALQKAIEGATDWQDELSRIFETYMAFATQNPELYQLCFERPVPGFTPSEESLQISFALLHSGYERAAHWRDAIDTDMSPAQLADLVIAMMHGLTALHLANEPHLPPGQGRFGALIPEALALLNKAWTKP
ncbi:MAG: TetR/AcrR family transcriptional regulator [Caldilineaceae bacterium]|nr:TetR/AcrR family transcriptional regulator [Caldilineaceae bacterium]